MKMPFIRRSALIAERHPDRGRGAAAVEFAIILPILVLLVFGIIEFGRGYNAQVTLTHAAREAVRDYAVNANNPDAIPTAVAVGQNAAANLSGVVVTILSTCTGASGEVAIAQAAWNFSYTIPLIPSGDIDLEETAVMRCGG